MRALRRRLRPPCPDLSRPRGKRRLLQRFELRLLLVEVRMRAHAATPADGPFARRIFSADGLGGSTMCNKSASNARMVVPSGQFGTLRGLKEFRDLLGVGLLARPLPLSAIDFLLLRDSAAAARPRRRRPRRRRRRPDDSGLGGAGGGGLLGRHRDGLICAAPPGGGGRNVCATVSGGGSFRGPLRRRPARPFGAIRSSRSRRRAREVRPLGRGARGAGKARSCGLAMDRRRLPCPVLREAAERVGVSP